ncbi:hypothetical protein nbrc107696_45300 [Gordonia spumicola]|uniref:DUF3500 domain-containing protein n=1 Tax=Gordonia spumicola TaxID=589161 RepID=A0A7I9V6G9_9ACTN|nr:DUF3500 domain-containing protein [Gordonia spumicola]GEE00792.1 hypothetical protein nbrc107696_12380 [Gordonia spumicola]GEE04084.1 hypothetical protein nbrc107696_45300 [Gordonia spumicola]
MSDLYEAPQTAQRLVVTAMGLIGTFSPQQREQAVIADFDDARRLDWDIIPKPDRTGIPLHDLDRHQRVLVWDMIRMTVPLRTFTKILGITQLEHVLRDYEGDFLGPALPSWRSSDSYYLTLFGRPGFEDTWTLRFLGHHVCVNVTVVDERWVAATPMALGAQPTEYDGVLKPLADDEGLGFDLLASLTDDQRATAVIHDVAPADFVTRQVPKIGAYEYPDHYDLGMPDYRIADADRAALTFRRDAPSGIASDDLTPDQQAGLLAIVDCYLDRLPPEAGERHRAAVREGGPIHFAWAGAQVRGEPHYFRVQTDRYLIEAVNAVGGGNHLHSVIRDLDNDFAAGILAEHAGTDTRWGRSHLVSRSVSSSVTGMMEG